MSSQYVNEADLNTLHRSYYGIYGKCYHVNEPDPITGAEKMTIEAPVCSCVMLKELVSDAQYDMAQCDEFVTPDLPAGKRIYRKSSENWHEPGIDHFLGFSQWNQDWFLYHNYFRGKRNGRFIDIGAMNAFELSNSAVFEQCFDWGGLCVEPNPTPRDTLHTYRKCHPIPYAICGRRAMKASEERVGRGTVWHFRHFVRIL